MAEMLETSTRPQPSQKLLTIGIPVFNGKELLRNCLHSVLESTLPRDRFEIVIADDGSSEPETLAILAEFEDSLAADEGFFRVVSLGANSGGAARPRNRVLDEARGEYVFFVDADDTIGRESLQRIADGLARTPADWVALNQVAVNGRAAVCVIPQQHIEVPRKKALMTLTVHKVFRRAEIERQQLRFDEGLPSGQDVAFAFSFLVQAERFLMLGGYDYYHLTQHADNRDEPTHLSRRARTPAARIEKNERIFRSMLRALRESNLSESERREILCQVPLPRLLLQEGYLKAIIKAGPDAGAKALRRLSELCTDPLIANLDPAMLTRGVTAEHLAVIADADWAGLVRLVDPDGPRPPARVGRAAQWVMRGRRFVDVASGRARHRRVVTELKSLRQSLEEMHKAQRRLEADLQAEFRRQRNGRRDGSG